MMMFPNSEAMMLLLWANALPNLTACMDDSDHHNIRNGCESSGGTPRREDWITHMEKLFQVLGCPDNFKTRLATFKLEGDALSWYFPTSEQQRYEHEYGSIYQLDRENSGEYMERFTRLASFCLEHAARRCSKASLDSSSRGKIVGFETGSLIRSIRMVAQVAAVCPVSMSIGVVRTRVSSIGVDRIGVMIRDNKIFRVRIRGLMVGMGMTAKVRGGPTETLPLSTSLTTCGKPHPGVCYKATGGCFTCGSTQHKVKDCPQAKQKQNMPTDFARLPP
ncbi:zinc finger, CCHC-type, retrotransposon gag domain protein [Tanacetum coccineum]